MAKDYYAVLGLPRGSSLPDIRAAYRALAARYHPDKFAANSADEQAAANLLMVEFNEAMSMLGNVAKRSQYDRELMAVTPPARANSRAARTVPEPPVQAGAGAATAAPPPPSSAGRKPAIEHRIRALRTRLQSLPLDWKELKAPPWAWSLIGDGGGRPLFIAHLHAAALDKKGVQSLDKAIDGLLAEHKGMLRSPWIVILLSCKLAPNAGPVVKDLDALAKRGRGWLKKQPMVLVYDEPSNRVLKFGEPPEADRFERILDVLLHP